MRKFTGRALFMGAVVVTTIGLGTPSAVADTRTATDGGAGTASGTVTLTLGDSGVTCDVDATGTLPDGTSNGSIDDIRFSNCTLNGFIPFSVTANGLPWSIIAFSQSGGVVTGAITGAIGLDFSSDIGCNGRVGGTTVPTTFELGGNALDLNGGGDLTLSNVSVTGCQNLIHDGDPAGLSGTIVLDPPVRLNANP